jgi:G3E family GTPase
MEYLWKARLVSARPSTGILSPRRSRGPSTVTGGDRVKHYAQRDEEEAAAFLDAVEALRETEKLRAKGVTFEDVEEDDRVVFPGRLEERWRVNEATFEETAEEDRATVGG